MGDSCCPLPFRRLGPSSALLRLGGQPGSAVLLHSVDGAGRGTLASWVATACWLSWSSLSEDPEVSAWWQDLAVSLAALCCSRPLVALFAAHWRLWMATACWAFWSSSFASLSSLIKNLALRRSGDVSWPHFRFRAVPFGHAGTARPRPSLRLHFSWDWLPVNWTSAASRRCSLRHPACG